LEQLRDNLEKVIATAPPSAPVLRTNLPDFNRRQVHDPRNALADSEAAQVSVMALQELIH